MTMKALYASEEAWKKNHESSGVGDGGGAAAAPSDAEHSAHYSTGEAAASFTSTHMTVRTTNTAASIEDEVVKYRKVKAKGWAVPCSVCHVIFLRADLVVAGMSS